MKNLVSQSHHRMYDALLASLEVSNPSLKSQIETGQVRVEAKEFFIRKKFSASETKPLLDLSQAVTAGITNLKDGKFPFEFIGAFGNVNFAIGYSASDAAASAVRYTNQMFDPTVASESSVGANAYQVDTLRIPVWAQNMELSFKVGEANILDRKPASTFFRQAAYVSDNQKHGGLHIENSYELEVPVITNGKNTPELEFFFPSGTSISNYTYFEFVIHGLIVRSSR